MSKLLSFSPGLSRLVGSRALLDRAVEVVELAPPHLAEAQPLIALPGEADRILNVEEHTDIAQQQHWISDQPNLHGATISRRFRQALIADGTVYHGLDYLVLDKSKRRPVIWNTVADHKTAELCSSIASSLVFAHWMRDALLLQVLANERHLPHVNASNEHWPHAAGYRDLFGLPLNLNRFALVEDLWITDDRGLNAAWAKRFAMLRSRLQSRVRAKGGASRVYICRGSSGSSRELRNAEEIKAILAGEGYMIIEPEKMTPDAIASALVEARIVVSVEGSALNHAQYALSEGAAILSIQPPHRFNAFHRLFTDLSGLRFGYVIATPVAGGFILPPARLLRTLELVERAI